MSNDLKQDIVPALNNLKRLANIDEQLPASDSDSNTAKSVRCILVLAVVARVLVDEIFKASTLVHGDIELRQELCFLAWENPSKEEFTRAILVSLHDQDYHDEKLSELAQQISRDVKEIIGLSAAELFRNDIHTIFAAATSIWREIQCMKSHFEVRMWSRGKPETQMHWRSIKLSRDELTFEEQDAALNAFDKDKVEFAVFPRVYSIARLEGKNKPETIAETLVVAGKVIQQSQMVAAKDELAKKENVSAPRRSFTGGSDRRRQTLRKGSQSQENTFLESATGPQKP